MIRNTVMVLGLLVTINCGVVCAQDSKDMELKPAIRFEIQELKATPVIDADHPDCKDIKYGFEGGSVVNLEGVYHLFVAEMAGDPFWVWMRLAHWTSANGITWKRQSTIKETTGQSRARTGLPYESVWAPIPVLNQAANRWDLFYTAENSKRFWPLDMIRLKQITETR